MAEWDVGLWFYGRIGVALLDLGLGGEAAQALQFGEERGPAAAVPVPLRNQRPLTAPLSYPFR